MRKKVISIILLLAMVMSLVACKDDEAAKEEERVRQQLIAMGILTEDGKEKPSVQAKPTVTPLPTEAPKPTNPPYMDEEGNYRGELITNDNLLPFTDKYKALNDENATECIEIFSLSDSDIERIYDLGVYYALQTRNYAAGLDYDEILKSMETSTGLSKKAEKLIKKNREKTEDEYKYIYDIEGVGLFAGMPKAGIDDYIRPCLFVAYSYNENGEDGKEIVYLKFGETEKGWKITGEYDW